jgi:hypothetical protein
LPVDREATNDEIRMTNDEANPNLRMTDDQNWGSRFSRRFSHSIIRHSNLTRHSSFVIRLSAAVAA